jgi:hypothetical protein
VRQAWMRLVVVGTCALAAACSSSAPQHGDLVAPGLSDVRTGGKGELKRAGDRGTLSLHQVPLSRSAAAHSARVVSTKCSERDTSSVTSWLMVEVTAPQQPLASFKGIEIRYGSEKSLELPFNMTVCQMDLDDPACSSYATTE